MARWLNRWPGDGPAFAWPDHDSAEDRNRRPSPRLMPSGDRPPIIGAIGKRQSSGLSTALLKRQQIAATAREQKEEAKRNSEAKIKDLARIPKKK